MAEIANRSPQHDGCTCLWVTRDFEWFPTKDGYEVTLPTYGRVSIPDENCPAAPHASEWRVEKPS